jgi:hypothetical protein
MSRLSRFTHLERQRPAPADPATGVVQQRFGNATPAVPQAETAPRSGAETKRFAAEPMVPEQERPLRLREDDEGLPFIRCGSCRFDNPVQARACEHCGTDLTTPMQRSFNQALHERLATERDETRVEVARLDAARVAAQQEYKEILRRGLIPSRETVSRPESSNPVRIRFDALGRVIGIWLAQRFPNRRVRHTLLAAFFVGWIVAVCRAPLPVSLLTIAAMALGTLLAPRRKAGAN